MKARRKGCILRKGGKGEHRGNVIEENMPILLRLSFTGHDSVRNAPVKQELSAVRHIGTRIGIEINGFQKARVQKCLLAICQNRAV